MRKRTGQAFGINFLLFSFLTIQFYSLSICVVLPCKVHVIKAVHSGKFLKPHGNMHRIQSFILVVMKVLLEMKSKKSKDLKSPGLQDETKKRRADWISVILFNLFVAALIITLIKIIF